MIHKSYSSSVSKERLVIYKGTFQHLDLLKPTKTSQARAGSSFLVPKNNSHLLGVPRSHTLPETPPHPDEQPLPLPETYEQLDQFIDQCIHEWAIWLINTELKHSQLQYKHRRPYSITEWQKLLPLTALKHKEATTD
jgi:hypothetical protein